MAAKRTASLTIVFILLAATSHAFYVPRLKVSKLYFLQLQLHLQQEAQLLLRQPIVLRARVHQLKQLLLSILTPGLPYIHCDRTSRPVNKNVNTGAVITAKSCTDRAGCS